MTPQLLDAAAPPDVAWPILVPLDTPSLPSIDVRHLPAWAGAYAEALAAHTETPVELATGMVLVAVASAAARRVKVSLMPGYAELCNLWVVVALPSGNRKSAVQSLATAPLSDWERERATALVAEIAQKTSERKSLEARVKHLRVRAARERDANKADELARRAAEVEAALPVIPVPPRIWTSDATPERMGSLLAEHEECMAWLSSEGGIFELLGGRYSNGVPNLDLFLKSHSGDPERVDRGSRPPVFLRTPRLSVGLSPQPELLRGLASGTVFRGRGLLARFLYLLPRSLLGYRSLDPAPIPANINSDYAAGLCAILNWAPASNDPDGLHTLTLSARARDEHHAFALVMESQMRPGEPFENCTDWAGKAAGAAARLAALMHAIKHAHGEPWKVPITYETMSAALDLVSVFAEHSRAALGLMGADPSINAAQTVWAWVERNQLARFTVRDAFTKLRGRFPRVRKLREAFDTLAERGYLEVLDVPNDGPGRPPSPVVIVRPDLVRSWQ